MLEQKLIIHQATCRSQHATENENQPASVRPPSCLCSPVATTPLSPMTKTSASSIWVRALS